MNSRETLDCQREHEVEGRKKEQKCRCGIRNLVEVWGDGRIVPSSSQMSLTIKGRFVLSFLLLSFALSLSFFPFYIFAER